MSDRTAPGAAPRASSPPDTGASGRVAASARLRVVVGRLARRIRQRHPGGVTASQLSVLVAVESSQPVRLSDLASCENVSAPTMTRLVTSLVEAGLAERLPDPVDGRSARVALTPDGQDRLDLLRRERTTFLVQRVDRLPPEDYARLLAALPVLESLLEDDPAGTPEAAGGPDRTE